MDKQEDEEQLDKELDELDEIEDKMLEEDEEKRQKDMLVSGKSVFDLQKIKNDKSSKHKDDEVAR